MSANFMDRFYGLLFIGVMSFIIILDIVFISGSVGCILMIIGAALLLAVVALPFGAPSLAAESDGTIQLKYVSMDSSYAAGPGVGTRVKGTDGCDQSDSNYARLLAKRRNLHLEDVSCPGVTTTDIFQRQINHVDADIRLVTVTIGGNNVNYVGNLQGYSCRDDKHGGTVARRSYPVCTWSRTFKS
ncbi:MAG: GDSL-type esterase/lipase family protein [Rhizonema sp. PD38]|nr:GDSL-type esterase/lipase family protein [Rhizonema sp. PD38]